jgi:phage baseplate assembly protein W
MSRKEKELYKRVTVEGTTTVESGRRSYRGFSTVSNVAEGFALYDFELIKQDIINHFHIRQGEKLSDPTFGTIIWDILFEPFTEEVKQAITENVTQIVNYDPRLNAESVIVDTYESGIQIELTLTYLPYNISEAMKFRFDQSLMLD